MTSPVNPRFGTHQRILFDVSQEERDCHLGRAVLGDQNLIGDGGKRSLSDAQHAVCEGADDQAGSRPLPPPTPPLSTPLHPPPNPFLTPANPRLEHPPPPQRTTAERHPMRSDRRAPMRVGAAMRMMAGVVVSSSQSFTSGGSTSGGKAQPL